jgi:lipopolysaccharide heptosyltransferase II
VTDRVRPWREATNILCVRLDSLGDVLMTTPAIRAVKQSAPGRRVTLLTSPAGAAAAHLIPEVDDAIVFEVPWMKGTPPRPDSRLDLELIEALRSRRFDAAVIFTVFSQNPLPAATYCYLADIPLRLAHCREQSYQLLTDWVRETEPEQGIRHEVQRQLDLVATICATTEDTRLSGSIPADDRAAVRLLLSNFQITDERWIVLHAGASAPSRRYPPELYAVAARGLSALGYRIVLTGSADEAELVNSIQQSVPGAVSLAGRLSLSELAAVIQAAPLLISNNTGPAHLAAGLGTPVVVLYALTNPQHTPWQVPQRVLSFNVPCGPCFRSVCPEEHHRCLTEITPGQVVQAALELLAETMTATRGIANSLVPLLT